MGEVTETLRKAIDWDIIIIIIGIVFHDVHVHGVSGPVVLVICHQKQLGEGLHFFDETWDVVRSQWSLRSPTVQPRFRDSWVGEY